MADLVAEMKAKEVAGEIPHPKGAGTDAVAEYAAHAHKMQVAICIKVDEFIKHDGFF